ncbi:EAL domain-containing protein [Dethiothermospora halolimnae]|uniref:sensor domain-containing protein n=1 Tax=Dethiothermospora halolimnae TaxID=3114390 RepID=UPI003CCBF93F
MKNIIDIINLNIEENSISPKRIGMKIVGIYLFVGVLWVGLSDKILSMIFSNFSIYGKVQLFKGWLFVILTAILLFQLIYNSLKKIKKLIYKVNESNEELNTLNEELIAVEDELEDKILALDDMKTQLKNERDFANNILDGGNLSIIIWTLDGVVVDINQYTLELLGYNRDEVLYKKLFDSIVPKEEMDSIKYVLDNIEENRFLNDFENKVIAKDKTEFIFLWNNNIIKGTDNKKYIASFGVDITKQRLQERKIFNLAYYDSLTGLNNRSKLERMINEYLQDDDIENFAIIYFDLDNFKNINDTYGHTYGDNLLKSISQKLLKLTNDNIMLFRLGGDEFLYVYKNYSNKKEVDILRKKIMNVFKNQWSIENYEFYISISVGICYYPEHGNTYTELLRNADTAMYNAKRNEKGTFRVFDKNMYCEIKNTVELEKDLRKAILNEEFYLNFQPIVDLSTGKIRSFETLIRWHHPHKGFIPPNKFIDSAEKNGLIYIIGNWVISEVFKIQRQRKKENKKDIKISINLSPNQLDHESFIEFLEDQVEVYDIDTSLIEFEITEMSLIKDFDKAVIKLNKMKIMGFSIALDDFGTGFSSINYLRKLPIDYIKIDKSYIDNIHTTLKDLNLVNIIIQMKEIFNYKIIAEGIEYDRQETLLKNLRCDYGQGYLFYKPMGYDKLNEIPEENIWE